MYGTLVDPTALKRLNSSDDKFEKLKNEAGPITIARKLAAQKDEVRDEHGRRRFHGAFTGGFSAGYFNTVGSAEGWQPKSFTSSRASRAAEQAAADGAGMGGQGQRAPVHGVLDYMDDEDAEQILAGSMGLRESMGAKASVPSKRKHGELEPDGDLFQSLFSDGRGAPGKDKELGWAAAPSAAAGPQVKSAAAQLTALPPELQAPKRVSIGERLLRSLGWREGRKLGVKRTDLPAIASTAAASDDDEAILRRLWAVGTSRPVSARSGLGYDPGSLHTAHGDGGAGTGYGLASGLGMIQTSANILAEKDAAGKAEGTKRLHMSAVLGGQARGYTSGSALSSALLAGDDEGEDDGGAYRSLDWTQYDIASHRHTTGLDVDRRDRKEHARLGIAGRGAGGVGGLGRRDGHSEGEKGIGMLTEDAETGRARRLLKDSAQASAATSKRSESEQQLGFDGHPPLPGCHLSRQRELSFLQFSQAYAPPVPPAGWVPKAPSLRTEEPLLLYAAHGFTPASAFGLPTTMHVQPTAAVQRTSHTTSAAPSLPPPPPSITGVQQVDATQGPARGIDPLLASRFVKEGDSSGAVNSKTVFSALNAPVPSVGSKLAIKSTVWAPSRLVLKRLGLPDPLTQADRAKLEGGSTHATPGMSEGVGVGGSDWGSIMQAAQAAASKAGFGQATGAGADAGPLSMEEKQQLGLDPTYAPLVAPKPSAQMFKAIFDSDSEGD